MTGDNSTFQKNPNIFILKKALINKTITKLQFDVYMVLLNIPAGKVTTYKNIANIVKCNSSRAIGQALRRNPFAPDVPCHRVVKSDLTLGGFSGSTGNKTVERKLKILQSEGVEFQPLKDKKLEIYHTKVKEEHIWKQST
ncbi:CLUMA_CG010793, isoform A [Clunio marinus]|uniref:Methylated-DNA--protein-cysteine methyltransferase n=1 Tax=Clunio marinus TaxID=568069 RepID=A0A1J1IB14_9DIPT|nr:CLUMA_CG010793, isoform A [Clunio marinus]